jgi:hypothetical protein
VVLPDVSRHQRATFIDRSAKNDVATNANMRTAWRFLSQVFPDDIFVHLSG